MIVSVLTCDRSPSYLAGTLASLRATAPDVEPRLFRDEWDRGIPPEQRLTLSFRRALLESDGDALIIEDDVEFRPNWPALLDAATAKLRARHMQPERFFLSLYCPHWLVGDTVARYRERTFFGTQGQFVSDAVRRELADYLDRHRAETTVDALIARWAPSAGVPLLATVPSLVQHVGRVSALGDAFHSSPMWGRKH